MIRVISIFIVMALFGLSLFYITRTPFPNTPARPAIGKLNSASYEAGRMVIWYNHDKGPTVALLASAGGKPILVVQALQDRIAPKAETADILAAQLPDTVSIMSIENVGHALLPEQPGKINTAVIEFLNSHREGSYE